jgi:ABC-2 type transport system permease protein
MKLFRLVENEVIKIIFKRRLLVISAILLVLISLYAYGENYTLNKTKEQIAKRIGAENSADWRKITEQQIIDMKKRLDSSYITEESKTSTRVRIEQLNYYLQNNISPADSSSAKFTTRFMEQSIFLFFPLLIIILAADMVSGEAVTGTIKLLLTRNVPRWKILLSKFLALGVMEINVLFISAALSILISGLYFGYGGWMVPVATGFKVIGGKLDVLGVQNVPQWKYALMVYALAFFVSLVVGSISFMISVLVKSTSASIGIMMSTLVGGSFLSYFIPDWKITRYLFMVNLHLTDYLSGTFQPIDGLTMAFSVGVLAAWGAAALTVSFVYFIRHDVLV